MITNVDSGINSVIDNPIITASERLKQNVIKRFTWHSFHFKKITKEPKTVDRPAIVVTISGAKKDIFITTKIYAK